MSDLNTLQVHSVMAEPTRVDPSTYEELGREVVKLALAEGLDLSDAAVSLLKDYPQFNATQIGNVCWSANNECFRKLAERRKEEGAGDLMFEFPLADPPDVLKRLDKTAEPETKLLPDVDYQNPPLQPVAKEGGWETLYQAFGYKNAQEINPNVPIHNPFKKVSDIRESLEQVKESCALKISHLQHAIGNLEDRLHGQVKSAVLQSVPLSHISTLLAQAGDESAVIAEMQKVAQRMAAAPDNGEGFYYLKQSAAITDVPVGVPDTEHEMFKTFAALRDAREQIKVAQAAREIAERDYAHVLKVEEKCVNYMANRK